MFCYLKTGEDYAETKVTSKFRSLSKIYFKVFEKKIRIEQVVHEKLKLNVVNQTTI